MIDTTQLWVTALLFMTVFSASVGAAIGALLAWFIAKRYDIVIAKGERTLK